MWQKLQPREKLLLAILGACIILFALFNFLLIPQYNTFTEDKNKMAQLEAQAKAAEAVLASEKNETELSAKASQKLNEVKPVFDNRMTDGLAITFIGMEAIRANVRIDTFIPSEIVNKGTYLELPAKFEVSGDYPNVVTFIEKMEGLPNLSELRSLKILPEKEAAAPNTTNTSVVKDYVNAKQNAAATSVQSGKVIATFDLVIYSSADPDSTLKLEQAAGWKVGRQNAFQTPGSASSFPGIEIQDKTLSR